MLFSIPYNSQDPDKFLKSFLPYLDSIHSFYFGMFGVFTCHNPPNGLAHDRLNLDCNNYQFLRKLNGRCQSVLCINTILYPKTYEETVYEVVRELSVLIELGLSAVNIASTTLAEIIHSEFPKLDIQTSCNTYSFLNQTSKYWHKCFGTTVFNLPRETLRTPSLLEGFKTLGYKSKCIVNEGCLYGCPGNIEHACSFLFPRDAVAVRYFCDRLDLKLSDIFRTNFIPPHRLSEFEDKIDIAKIAGRAFQTERILKTFLAYLNGDSSIDIQTVFHAKCRRWLRERNLNFPVKFWPKKTLTCMCQNCETCQICDKAMDHILKNANSTVCK